MISTVIVGLIWRWIFGENSGIVNYLLSLLKGSGLPWLTDSTLAMVTLVIATIWSKAGYFMIIFVGAIEAIPTSYYEAAFLDGAKPWQVFRRITFPLLKPTNFYGYFAVHDQLVQGISDDSVLDGRRSLGCNDDDRSVYLQNWL